MGNQIAKSPRHIGIIMDGNARWAKSKHLPVKMGHKQGAQSIQTLINSSIEFGIQYLTIFAFSTENWDRPKDEIDNLMDLMNSYLKSQSKKFIEGGIKILISGSLDNVKNNIKDQVLELQSATKDNNKITLNVAFDYGSRREIVDAFKKIISNMDLKDNTIDTIDTIDEDLISQNLYNPQMPDPDLIIRTSGEKRLSNFLLWQSAYSEFYFTDTLWPDFGKEDLALAISDFKNRQRNYGSR
jgi:undecaprenyl diphosphate synthase